MIEITSRDNQKLKFARAVRDGRERDSIFIEGRRLVGEAVISQLSIQMMFVSDAFPSDEAERLIPEFAGRLYLLPERVFRSISDTETPQGIAAIADRPSEGRIAIEHRLSDRGLDPALALVLQRVNNPSNLGAVIRVAEAAGVAGVVTTVGSADAYSPRSLRAAMGSAFRLPVWENADLSELISWSQENGINVAALDIKANQTIYELDWKPPRLLIFGSEAHGLDQDLLGSVDEIVKIPMSGSAESLNLAVSCGITLFEAKRAIGG